MLLRLKYRHSSYMSCCIPSSSSIWDLRSYNLYELLFPLFVYKSFLQPVRILRGRGAMSFFGWRRYYGLEEVFSNMPKPTDCFHPSCLSVIGVLVFDPSYVHWIENTSKALSHCSAQKGFSVFFFGGGDGFVLFWGAIGWVSRCKWGTLSITVEPLEN